jgi:hypothetical protein
VCVCVCVCVCKRRINQSYHKSQTVTRNTVEKSVEVEGVSAGMQIDVALHAMQCARSSCPGG